MSRSIVLRGAYPTLTLGGWAQFARYQQWQAELGGDEDSAPVDLLFQSVFHARMAEEAGHFTINDVVRDLVTKMIDRHPHVFGTERIENAEAQVGAWETMKAAERDEAVVA